MASTGALTRRAAIIYNPIRVDFERLRRTIIKMEAREGWAESLWLATALDSPTSTLVGDAVGTNIDLVIAAGGDGTVNEVAAALRQSGVPLGILPCGTANLLARNLQLPLNNLAAAARIAFTGGDRPIDVALITYRLVGGATAVRPYFVMAGFGIDADMVAGTNTVAKSRFGWMAYVTPIVRSAFRTSRASVTWSLDGSESTSARLHTLIVGNCSTVTAGLRLLPGAAIDDGLLDILALRSLVGRDRQRFMNWLAPYQGPKPSTEPPTDADGGDTFRYRTAKKVTLTLHDPTTFQADGDLIGTVEWAEFSVDPSAVSVRVG